MGLHVTIRALRASDWDWIKLRAAPVLCEDTDGFVAFKGEDLVAAVVFDSWSDNSCLAHVVVEDPFAIRAGLLTWGFKFVFEAKGRNLITGLTPADNMEALKFNKHLGFREVYRIPEGYKPGIDYVLQEMRKDECRWLNYRLKKVA